MTTGNETTETATALGVMRGARLWLRGAPESLRNAIDPEAVGAELLASPCAGMDIAVIVIDSEQRLDRELQALSGLIQPAGHVWILWQDGGINHDRVSDRARADGFIAGDTHDIDGRWQGIRLDPAPGSAR